MTDTLNKQNGSAKEKAWKNISLKVLKGKAPSWQEYEKYISEIQMEKAKLQDELNLIKPTYDGQGGIIREQQKEIDNLNKLRVFLKNQNSGLTIEVDNLRIAIAQLTKEKYGLQNYAMTNTDSCNGR